MRNFHAKSTVFVDSGAQVVIYRKSMEHFLNKLSALFDQNGISAWVYGPLIAGLWLVLLLTVKWTAFRHFRRLARLTSNPLDDALLESVNHPATIVIWGSAIAIFGKLVTLGDKWLWITSKIFQTSLVIALVVAANSLLIRLLELNSDNEKLQGVSLGFLKGLIRGIVIGLGALIFLDMIGVSITPILASLGVGSLAVALGLQTTLSNLFAGLQIMADKSVRVGNYVKLSTGEEGYVTEIGWRSTRIQMLQNNTVIVPNSQMVNNMLTNYYLPTKDLAVLVQVGVHYDSDLEKVENVTLEVAREILRKIPGGISDFEPLVRFHTFSDSSINFTVVLRGREYVDQHLLKHEFIKMLHQRYRKEGIVIPFPMRTLDIPKDVLEELKKI